MSGAIAVGALVAAGVWLVLQRGRVRTVLGFALLTHAVNLLIVLGATGQGRAPAFVGVSGNPADPLPQAFVLTAIVISLGVTAFLLALSTRPDEADDRGDTDAPADGDQGDGGDGEPDRRSGDPGGPGLGRERATAGAGPTLP